MTAGVGTDLWFRNYAPAPDASTRLVCLPHAGGSASFYLPVARALSPGIDVIAAQYPGRQDRRSEPCLPSVADLADALVDALIPWCDRPVALFGHSLGAIVGFEVARRLESHEDVELLRLFASGRRAPLTVRDELVHQRDDDGVLAELKALNGTDASVLGDEEIMRMALPAIRSDYRAAELYRHDGGAPVRCPITVLVGDDDPRTSLEEARCWGRVTAAGIDQHVFTGGHFYLIDHAAEVLEIIRDQLRG
jgi:surfactin synthase thioesterase subunit